MVRLVQNERSWAIDLISHINRLVENKTLHIKRAGGETTINNSNSTAENKRSIMFPDVLLYEDSSKSQIIQGWEIKLPDVSITDNIFIKDAQYKADTLGLKSTLLWNFKSVVLYVKNEENEWELYKSWNELNHIQTRSDVGFYQNDWIELLEAVLIDLNEFFTNDTIVSTKLENLLTQFLMSNFLKGNQPLVTDLLESRAATNRVIDIKLEEWWNEAKLEYENDEPSKYSAYSKLIVSHWLIKITFAHLIKSHHNPAKKVEEINYEMKIEDAVQIFEEITAEVDYYTIFSPMEYSEVLPLSFWKNITDYNSFLADQGISDLNHEVLQTLLEQSVKGIRRETIGQFTTPPLLAELLVNSTVKDTNSDVIDPCCGSGTIVKAALNLKKEFLDNKNAHQTVWGSDKFKYPLQLANLALTDFSSINIANKVFSSNVFNLTPGDKITLTSPSTGDLIDYTIPKFKTIVSNLPFVPFEKISEDEKVIIKEMISDIESNYDINLSERSDLYTYITLHLWNITEKDGRVGLILSNSWLGTLSGREFYDVLRKLYHIEYILISGNKRWFKNADVVTTMLVLTKKESSEKSKNTRFGVMKCPLDDLENKSVSNEISNHILANSDVDSNLLSTTEYSTEQINELLYFKISINSLFHNIDWLLLIKESLIPIDDEFLVVRGMRRGWDPMFYPAEGHNIESEYVHPVLKSSRNVRGLNATPDRDAFSCADSLEEIKEKGNMSTYNWIKKFEVETNKVGESLPISLQRSAGRNEYWYQMNTESKAEIVTTMNPDRRLFYSKLDSKSFINQRLIGLSRKHKKSNLELNHALLNSLVGIFFIEALGFGRGLGALDFSATTLSESYMLDPELISSENKNKIIEAFKILEKRDLLPFSDEIEQNDRKEFEKIVLESYGYTALFEPIISSIASMHKTRLTATTI